MNTPVYYAHSMKIYDTRREEAEMSYLRRVFRKVIDPNNDLGELGSMNAYLKVVGTCGTVVISEYLDNVGRGVFEEAREALKLDIPVFVLRQGGFGYDLFPVKAVKMVDPSDWKVRFGAVEVAPRKLTLRERLRKILRMGPGCRYCFAYPDRCDILNRQMKTCECRKCWDKWCEFRGDGYNVCEPCAGLK